MMDSISNTAFERFKVQRSEDRSGEAEKRGNGTEGRGQKIGRLEGEKFR